MKKQIVLPALLLLFATQMEAQKKWSETSKGSFNRIENKGGQTLGKIIPKLL
jgi:beta-glucosidase